MEHQGIDTDFLTIFYPNNSEQIIINSIEDDSSYIGLLLNRPENYYDIVIVQNQNNLINVDGFTSFLGDSIPNIQTTANFLFVSMSRTNPFDLNGIRVFGNGDLDDAVF